MTTANDALGELPEAANEIFYGAWAIKHRKAILRALRQSAAIDSGELVRDKTWNNDGHYLTDMDAGFNACLDELKAME